MESKAVEMISYSKMPLRGIHFRAGVAVWAGWARAPPLFGGNRVKPGPGPTTFFWRIRAGPHQFQNRDSSPEYLMADMSAQR